MLSKLVAGRTRDIMRPAFPTLGTLWSGICDLLPPQVTAGCFSLSRVRLQDPGKSFGVAVILFCKNHLSLFALCHVNQYGRRNGQSAVKG